MGCYLHDICLVCKYSKCTISSSVRWNTAWWRHHLVIKTSIILCVIPNLPYMYMYSIKLQKVQLNVFRIVYMVCSTWTCSTFNGLSFCLISDANTMHLLMFQYGTAACCLCCAAGDSHHSFASTACTLATAVWSLVSYVAGGTLEDL